jgi:hypothetical protein
MPGTATVCLGVRGRGPPPRPYRCDVRDNAEIGYVMFHAERSAMRAVLAATEAATEPAPEPAAGTVARVTGAGPRCGLA